MGCLEAEPEMVVILVHAFYWVGWGGWAVWTGQQKLLMKCPVSGSPSKWLLATCSLHQRCLPSEIPSTHAKVDSYGGLPLLFFPSPKALLLLWPQTSSLVPSAMEFLSPAHSTPQHLGAQVKPQSLFHLDQLVLGQMHLV